MKLGLYYLPKMKKEEIFERFFINRRRERVSQKFWMKYLINILSYLFFSIFNNSPILCMCDDVN